MPWACALGNVVRILEDGFFIGDSHVFDAAPELSEVLEDDEFWCWEKSCW